MEIMGTDSRVSDGEDSDAALLKDLTLPGLRSTSGLLWSISSILQGAMLGYVCALVRRPV